MFSNLKRRNKRTTPARVTAVAMVGAGITVSTLVATNVIPVPSWAQLDGVDVASHQHPNGAAIDWQQVAASGQKFAFVKATEGTGYSNPYFTTDSQKAEQAGIMPGSYHYAKPGLRDPRGEARFYATSLATGPQPSLPPVLDLEETGGLSPNELKQWVREFTDEIMAQTGRKPIIYTYYAFWKQQMANTTEFSEFPLWLAYYNDTPPSDVPGGWNEMTFWQYTGTGRVDGVITDVDMNTYYGDDAQLQALAADLPASTTAGAISKALSPLKEAAGDEAEIANTIEHATGVDIPLTTDFLMLVLGVIGGRLPASTLLTQGAAELERQGVMGENVNNADAAAGSGGEGARDSLGSTQEILKMVQALANALNEFNGNGEKLPVDMLLNLAKTAIGADGTISAGQLLGLLNTYGGTQDWGKKLDNNEVQATPLAYLNLARALLDAEPTEPGAEAASSIDLPTLLRPEIEKAAKDGSLPKEAAQLMNLGSAMSRKAEGAAPSEEAAAEQAPEAAKASKPAEQAAPSAPAPAAPSTAAPAGLPY